MTSLVIYVISFVIIIGIVGSITTMFNSNISEINTSSGIAAEYNIFNVYMLNQTKEGFSIYKYGDSKTDSTVENTFVTFSNGETLNTFVHLGNILYFNNAKLCENIEDFQVKVENAENGNQVLKTYLDINGTVYTTDYVIE